MRSNGAPHITWNMVWILMFGIGFGLFFCGMPKFLDDYWYMDHLRPWFESQGILYPENGGNIFVAGLPWREILDTWREHYLIDNVRLSNLLAPIFLLMPKWVGSGLMAILLTWSVLLGLQLAGTDWRRSPLVPPALALWTLFPVWSDHFGSLVFQLNYVLPTWLSLLLLLRLKRSGAFVADVRCNVRELAAVLCLSLLVGICHEGFSLPIFVGLSVAAALHRDCRNAPVWTALAGLFAGVLLLLSVPGMHTRIGDDAGEFGLWRIRYAHYVLLPLMPVYLCALVAACATAVKGTCHDATFLPLSVVFGVSGLVCVALQVFASSGVRASFWMQFSSVIWLVMCLRSGWPRFCARYNLGSALLALPLLCVSFLHLAFLDVYSFKCRRIFSDALMAHVDDNKASVFESESYFATRPLLLGNRPDAFNNDGLMYVDRYYDIRSTPTLMMHDDYTPIIPRELRGVDGRQGILVDKEQALRYYRGSLYMPYENLLLAGFEPGTSEMTIELDYGKGYGRAAVRGEKFRSAADGRDYVWLRPHTAFYLDHIRTLQRARLLMSD